MSASNIARLEGTSAISLRSVHNPAIMCGRASPTRTHLVSATSTLGVSVVAAVRSTSELSTQRRLWRVRPGAGRGQ